MPIVVAIAYVAVSFRVARGSLRGGPGLRTRLRAALSRGPGWFLGEAWRPLLFALVGLVVLIVSVNTAADYAAYQAAPACGPNTRAECRATVELLVESVEIHTSKPGAETIVNLVGYPPANFSSGDLPASEVEAGTSVDAEVWQGQVTALTIGGIKRQSYALDSNAWVGIAAGVLVLLVAITWLFADVTSDSVEGGVGAVGYSFAFPVKRRRALYVLLPTFGVLLALFGLAYVAVAVRAYSTADTLAAIYQIGALFTLPALILVFVAWCYRAYFNVGALGLHVRHSPWFVTAALLVPPFCLFMPYRLLREVMVRIDPPVSDRLLKNWWACAVGWLALTIVGLSIGSPDPSDTSLLNELSNAMQIGSVLAGLFGIWLTIKLISAIDSTEAALVTRGLSG